MHEDSWLASWFIIPVHQMKLELDIHTAWQTGHRQLRKHWCRSWQKEKSRLMGVKRRLWSFFCSWIGFGFYLCNRVIGTVRACFGGKIIHILVLVIFWKIAWKFWKNRAKTQCLPPVKFDKKFGIRSNFGIFFYFSKLSHFFHSFHFVMFMFFSLVWFICKNHFFSQFLTKKLIF
jgi:hypothetical protein